MSAAGPSTRTERGTGPAYAVVPGRRPEASVAGRPDDEGARGSRRTPLREVSSYFAAALSFEPAETLTEWPAGIWISAPVCGLRPVRAAR